MPCTTRLSGTTQEQYVDQGLIIRVDGGLVFCFSFVFVIQLMRFLNSFKISNEMYNCGTVSFNIDLQINRSI